MGQMTDFKKFIKTNKLKQKQVAAYLETSPQYISQVAKGLCSLSDEKYEKLVQGDWDISMLNIPPYIKVPSTLTVFNPTPEERQDFEASTVDISTVPVEVVEEIEEKVKEEMKEEMAVPVISTEIANRPNLNIRKYINDKAGELEHIDPSQLTQQADGAERIRKTSMLPTFAPGDIVFVRFLNDKHNIIDGHTYYFDMRTRPTMIRRVKVEGDKLRLIAKNPAFGDIVVSYDDILNIADIVGLFRSSFGDQYDEIEAVRTKKEQQIDNLIDEIRDAGKRTDILMHQNLELMKKLLEK